MSRAGMVCKRCLGSYYGGCEKTCTHGWDLLKGKPVEAYCAECGDWSNDLHCPDGPRIQTNVIASPVTL